MATPAGFQAVTNFCREIQVARNSAPAVPAPITARAVTHVLSILDPNWPEPEAFWTYDPHHRTVMHFNDAIEPGPGSSFRKHACRRDPVLRDASGATSPEAGGHLLVSIATRNFAVDGRHGDVADAGSSGGTRGAYSSAFAIRPQAWPNSRMIGFADHMLVRGGRLTTAFAAFMVAASRSARSLPMSCAPECEREVAMTVMPEQA